MSFLNSFIILEKYLSKSAIILFFMMLISMIIETLSIGMVIPAISILLDDQSFFKNNLAMSFLSFLGNPSRDMLIIITMIVIVIIFTIKSLYLIMFNWFQAKFIFNVQISLSNKLFAGYIWQPYLFHLNRNSSSLIRNIITEINTFASCTTSIIILFTEILVFIGISTLLIIYEPLGSIMSLFIFCLAGLIFYSLFKNRMSFWGTERQKFDEKKIQYIQEGLGGIKESKIYNKENIFIKQFNKQAIGSSEMGKRINFLSTFPRLFLELLIIIVMSVFVIYLISNNNSYQSIIATLGLFAVAAFRLLPSINKIISSIQFLRYNLPVLNLINDEISLVKKVSQVHELIDPIKFEESIQIKDLTFSYDQKTNILESLNLKINKGEKIGFIGETGSGKSTLVDIILGLLSPTDGEILVDGKNINESIKGWQTNLGYVPQTIFLSDDTLKRNIAYGFSDDQINDNTIMDSISSAQLNKFVNQLEKKYDTKVGERGVRLSGGQRQRIGIARALYNNPNVIIFDEATSALDYETENEIMKIINSLKEKTILIIAHRVNTLKDCDKVYELNNGRLSEKSYEEIKQDNKNN